jgi:hypothetical protein
VDVPPLHPQRTRLPHTWRAAAPATPSAHVVQRPSPPLSPAPTSSAAQSPPTPLQVRVCTTQLFLPDSVDHVTTLQSQLPLRYTRSGAHRSFVQVLATPSPTIPSSCSLFYVPSPFYPLHSHNSQPNVSSILPLLCTPYTPINQPSGCLQVPVDIRWIQCNCQVLRIAIATDIRFSSLQLLGHLLSVSREVPSSIAMNSVKPPLAKKYKFKRRV